MFACAICGHDGEEIHHIIPKSEGGNDTLNNLVLLCHSCHDKIHNHQPIWIHGSPFSGEAVRTYLKEYIEGDTVFDYVLRNEVKPAFVEQVKKCV